MPTSASTSTNRPEVLISLLRSESKEVKVKSLRELKNQIIGNRTKKLSYIKLGAVPKILEILSSSDDSESSILIQSAATIGSFACGVDVGVKAVLDSGAFPHLIRLLSHLDDKVVDAGARSLKMIYQSKLAPKYDFHKDGNMAFLLSLLNSENENVTELGASIITHSCETSAEQKVLCEAGALSRLLILLKGSLNQREASLDSLAAMTESNSEVISKFVGLDSGRALNSLTELLKDRYPRTRLLASVCLIVIGHTSPNYLQDIGIKTKLIMILIELLEEPGRVGDEVPFALANLIADKEDLQQLAFEINALDKLCSFLHNDTIHTKRLKGILLAIAELCSRLENCRARFMSMQALNLVTNALTHDCAEVRSAACICMRSVTRSVKNLSAGHFLDDMIVTPLVQLLHDQCTLVQVTALKTICNIVVDVTNRKSVFIQCGGLKELVLLSKSMDSTLRLNSVWALRNLMFLAESNNKERIVSEITASTLTSLVCDPEPSIQEQALALVRNLVDGGISSIEHVFVEGGIIINAVGRQVRNASKSEVCIQGIYILGNIATGSESHKEAVMHQLLQEAPSVLLKFLKCSDARLRVAAIWCVVNLTYPGGPGSSVRVARLRDSGIISQIKSMVNDSCLDAKFRVRTALEQCKPVLGCLGVKLSATNEQDHF
ncbi:Armadillo repeat-containing protein [Thalictrum thalictroides]|uniref:Armadillo repeat-containing protein n=1 Tax=Thalictrum thalictroides TaxID=46969 RepID=A0A7J6W7I5_THATH|nr:Armadillo repeat-containing protein [Thalictrum thalictroides]